MHFTEAKQVPETAVPSPYVLDPTIEVSHRCGHKVTIIEDARDQARVARMDCRKCWMAKRKKADEALMEKAIGMSVRCARLDGTQKQHDWAMLIRHRTLHSLRSTKAPSGLDVEWQRAFVLGKRIGSSQWWIENRSCLGRGAYQAFGAIARHSNEALLLSAAARLRRGSHLVSSPNEDDPEAVWGDIEQV